MGYSYEMSGYKPKGNLVSEGKRFRLPNGMKVELDKFKGVTIYGSGSNKVVLNRKDLGTFLKAAKKNLRVV